MPFAAIVGSYPLKSQYDMCITYKNPQKLVAFGVNELSENLTEYLLTDGYCPTVVDERFFAVLWKFC